MLIVSNYHYIRPSFESKFPSIFGVTPKKFELQLLKLRNYGDLISPKDLLTSLPEILQRKELFFLVTFDDGLKEQINYALPILENLEIPAIFFPNSINYIENKVSTVHKIHLLRSLLSSQEFIEKLSIDDLNLSIMEKKRSKEIYIYDDEDSAILKFILNFKLNYYEQERKISPIFNSYFNESEKIEELYMTERQIVELANRGYLGSHTHSHYPLGLLEPEHMKSELRSSKSFFENLSGGDIRFLAYPYGSEEACTAGVALEAKKAGYQIGLTTKRGVNNIADDPLLLKRYDCNDLPGGINYIEGKNEFFN
ncbi:MAG: polysaccharide deacetylase family protein [Bacteroidota bacterium]